MGWLASYLHESKYCTKVVFAQVKAPAGERAKRSATSCAARYGWSSTLLELGRLRPMRISAERIDDRSESCARVPARAVAIVYSPGLKLTDTWVVPSGLIGAVRAIAVAPPEREIASASDLLAWLVTVKTTGPAPIEDGDTEILESLTYTDRATGVGGRGRVGSRPPEVPHAEIPTAQVPTIAIILIRI
jgi:hypothetical protein